MKKETFETRFVEARRRYISDYFSRMNDQQREAVLATEGALLVLAGAGSGKTTVLMNRIANLLKFGSGSDSSEVPQAADESWIDAMERKLPGAEEYAAFRKVEPWRILAITFTNKAAGEMKDRLETLLGDSARDIWALTFHSACVRILRREAEYLGYTSDFTIYDTQDSLSVVKRIVKDLDLDEKTFQPRALLTEISRQKDAEIYPSEYTRRAEVSGDYRQRKTAIVYAEYARRLFTANAMDFDDLIALTVKVLKENEAVRTHWQNRFKYVLVDEYQDTNHMQYELATLLAGGYGNICVVGDDDQSIYKFRGATIENILSFEDEYKHCRVIRLEQNYRSTERILAAANAVIRNNLGRKGKELWTKNGKGDKLKLFVAENQDDEAYYVVKQLKRSHDGGNNWREHAILYRMNAQANAMESALTRAGVPYRIIGGTRFYDHAEVKDMLAYLCLIASPNDDLRFSRIVNVPARGIGERTVDLVRELAGENHCSMYDIAMQAERYPEISRAAAKLRKFTELMEALRAFAAVNTPEALYDELLEKTGYLRMLEASDDEKDRTRAENVKEVKSGIISYMKESGDTSLDGYLANVALYTDADNYDKDSDTVVLMTMHSAKGLEFPSVFLVGMEESIFPGIRAIGEPEEMEEERRLCYVALTRAKQQLVLTAAKQRLLFGKTTANRISRFVDEIPEELIEKKNVPRGYGYSDRSVSPFEGYYSRSAVASGYGSDYNRGYTGYAAAKKPASPPPKAAVNKSKPVLPELSVGDKVKHKAFGEGKVQTVLNLNGDTLVAIEFARVGLRKLMLSSAAQFLEKL